MVMAIAAPSGHEWATVIRGVLTTWFRSNALTDHGDAPPPAAPAGTTASLAAVMNAVADAGANIDMPATPERVWRALSAHGGGT
jgi:hypothetical protein